MSSLIEESAVKSEQGQGGLAHESEVLVAGVTAEAMRAMHHLEDEAKHGGLDVATLSKYEAALTASVAELQKMLTEHKTQLGALQFDATTKRGLVSQIKSAIVERLADEAEKAVTAMRGRITEATAVGEKLEGAVQTAAQKRAQKTHERAEIVRKEKARIELVEKFLPSLDKAGIGLDKVLDAARALQPDLVDTFISEKLESIEDYKSSLSSEKQSELSGIFYRAEHTKVGLENFKLSADLFIRETDISATRRNVDAIRGTVPAADFKEIERDVIALEKDHADAVDIEYATFIAGQEQTANAKHQTELTEFIMQTSGRELIHDALASGKLDIEALTKKVADGIKPKDFTVQMFAHLPAEMKQAIVAAIPEKKLIDGSLIISALPFANGEFTQQPIVLTKEFCDRQRAVSTDYNQEARWMRESVYKFAQYAQRQSLTDLEREAAVREAHSVVDRFRKLMIRQGLSQTDLEHVEVQSNLFKDDAEIFESPGKTSRSLQSLELYGYKGRGSAPEGQIIALKNLEDIAQNIGNSLEIADRGRKVLEDRMDTAGESIDKTKALIEQDIETCEQVKAMNQEIRDLIENTKLEGQRLNERLLGGIQTAAQAEEIIGALDALATRFDAEEKKLKDRVGGLNLSSRMSDSNNLHVSIQTKINSLESHRQTRTWSPGWSLADQYELNEAIKAEKEFRQSRQERHMFMTDRIDLQWGNLSTVKGQISAEKQRALSFQRQLKDNEIRGKQEAAARWERTVSALVETLKQTLYDEVSVINRQSEALLSQVNRETSIMNSALQDYSAAKVHFITRKALVPKIVIADDRLSDTMQEMKKDEMENQRTLIAERKESLIEKTTALKVAISARKEKMTIAGDAMLKQIGDLYDGKIPSKYTDILDRAKRDFDAVLAIVEQRLLTQLS